MKTVLLMSVPPLVGAVIGFVTNAIAIKMLFRPLREIRLFKGRGKGIRLPFTPGILPRERRRLAESIGAMVERELLTPEIIRQRLKQESLRQQVLRGIAEFTAHILEKPLTELLSSHELPVIDALIEKAWPRLADGVTAFLNKPDIHAELEEQGKKLVVSLMDKLSTFQRFFVEAGNYDRTVQEKMPEIVDDFILRVDALLRDAKTRGRIILALETENSGGGIAESLGWGALKNDLDAAIAEKIFSAADSRIEQLLAALDIKNMVEDRINSLEMIRVEKIVLDVMANQFKWINLFGAVLGALIGLVQALLSRIMGA